MTCIDWRLDTQNQFLIHLLNISDPKSLKSDAERRKGKRPPLVKVESEDGEALPVLIDHEDPQQLPGHVLQEPEETPDQDQPQEGDMDARRGSLPLDKVMMDKTVHVASMSPPRRPLMAPTPPGLEGGSVPRSSSQSKILSLNQIATINSAKSSHMANGIKVNSSSRSKSGKIHGQVSKNPGPFLESGIHRSHSNNVLSIRHHHIDSVENLLQNSDYEDDEDEDASSYNRYILLFLSVQKTGQWPSFASKQSSSIIFRMRPLSSSLVSKK